MLERIKKYIDSKGIKVSAFEKSIGMSNASFGKSLKRGGTIGSDKIEIILNKYPDINPIWLITGVGAMLKKEYDTPYQQQSENIVSESEIYYGSKKEKEYITIPFNEWEVMNNKIDNQFQTISDQKEIIAELKNIIELLKNELNINKGRSRDKQQNKTA